MRWHVAHATWINIVAPHSADLARPLDGTTPEGRTYSRPLGMLLLHVPTHAAHHRSELATMLTMVSGSPPDTGINSYYREKSERKSR